MKLIVKTILSGILGVSTLLPVAAIADNTGGTCSGSAGNVAPLEAQFRKDQAFTMTKDLLYKIVVALDNVLSTPADTAHDPDFFANIKFVTDLQETQDNMQIFIECTGSDCLDTVLQLRLPFAWHKPDGLRRVI